MMRMPFAALAAALGAGCGGYLEAPPWQIGDDAPPAQARNPADMRSTFVLRSDRGTALSLRVTATTITGTDVNLEHFCGAGGTAIRGRVFGRSVNIDLGGEHVTGLAADSPVDLVITLRDGDLHVNGSVAGGRARFVVGPDAARGTLGRCSYDLQRTDDGYEGRRSCGGPTAHTWLRIPTALDAWGDDARATVLALLLAGR